MFYKHKYENDINVIMYYNYGYEPVFLTRHLDAILNN